MGENVSAQNNPFVEASSSLAALSSFEEGIGDGTQATAGSSTGSTGIEPQGVW